MIPLIPVRGPRLLTLLLAVAVVLGCAGPTATAPAPPKPAATTPPATPTTASAPPAPTTVAAPPAARKLKIAVSLNVTLAPLLLALERGYFTQAGIELDMVPLGGGAEMVAPLSTGEIEAALGGISAGLYNALARGVEAKIVSDFSRMSRGHGFGAWLVRNDVEIANPASLRGKRVGFNNPGAPCHYMVGKHLAAWGLSLTDVEIIHIPFNTLPGAMAKKEVDAACAAEPWVANTVRAGDSRVGLTYDEIVPEMQVSVIMISPLLAADRPLTERFLAAILRAAPDGKQKTPEVMEVVSRHTGLPLDVLQDTIWTDIDNDGRVNLDSLRDQLDFYTRAGLVQGTVDLDRIVDLSYLPRR